MVVNDAPRGTASQSVATWSPTSNNFPSFTQVHQFAEREDLSSPAAGSPEGGEDAGLAQFPD